MLATQRIKSTNEVEKKIKAYIILPKRAKSTIWINFSALTDKDGNKLEFVRCDKGANVLNKNRHKSGTSGWRQCTCSTLRLVSSPLRIKHFFLHTLHKTLQRSVSKCAVESFDYGFVAMKGFVDFIKQFVNVAAN